MALPPQIEIARESEDEELLDSGRLKQDKFFATMSEQRKDGAELPENTKSNLGTTQNFEATAKKDLVSASQFSCNDREVSESVS